MLRNGLVGFALSLLATAAFSLNAWAGAQLWDFENGADDWEVANGDWEANGGVYQEVSGAGPALHSLVGEENWTDYVIEAKIRIDVGNWAGIVFRAVSEMEYYVYYLNVPDNKSELWRHIAGAFDARNAINSNLGAQGGVVIANNEWMDVRVVVEGGAFEFWINGEMQGELQDAEYDTGRIGVWTWTSQASFDDVTVTGDNIDDTLAVEAGDKLATKWAELKLRE